MPSAVIVVTAITSGLGVLLNSTVLYLVLSRGRERYHYLFAGVLAICAVWDLGIFLTMIRNSFPNEVVIYGYVIIPCTFLPALIYHFTCTYLEQPRKKTTLFLWVFCIVGLVLIATGVGGRLAGVYDYRWGHLFRPDPLLRIGTLASLPVYYFAYLSACWFLFRAYRRESSSSLARRHTLYMLVGFLVISAAMVKIAVFLGVDMPYLMTAGMLLTDIFGAVIGIAIIKDHLLDITVIVKVGFIYSVLAALVLFVFSFSEHLLTTYVAERLGGHSGAVHLIALAVALAVLMPVKHRLEHAVEEFFARRKLQF